MLSTHPFAGIKFHSVVYLGAGFGDSLNDLLTQVNSEQWHIVEGDSKKYKLLQQAIDDLNDKSKITLHKCAVADNERTEAWFSYNLDEFSGLKKAQGLSDLFPGIKLKREEAVDTEALPSFLLQLELSSTENNLLIIDLPGQALELLQSLVKAGQKSLFPQVVLTATNEQLFEQGDTCEQIKQWLDTCGYHTRNEPSDDPDFPVLYYSFDRNAAAEFEKLQREVEQLTQERDDAVARASGTREELNDYKQSADSQIEDLKNKNNTLVKESQQLSEEKQAALDRINILEQDLQQAKIENQGLKQTVEVLKQTLNDMQSQLIQKVDSLATLQNRQAERLEISLGMQQFWQTGEYPDLYIGNSLGPQLKKYLIQKLSQEHYDVIIQFGVSDSTLFLAKVLENLREFGRKLTSMNIDRSLSFKNRNEIATNGADEYSDSLDNSSLPAEICLFEQNISKLSDLELQAKQKQLSSLFSTKHAPLVDYSYHGEDYLHYESDDSIQQLKQLLEGRKAKLLVLISGPNTWGDERNRFPAVPKILNAFGNHELHFVTDNYYEKSAKQVAVNWSRLFDQRGLSIEKHIIADDKPSFAWLINR